MIFDIVQGNDGHTYFKEVKFGQAWNCLDLLRNAFADTITCWIGCYDGYENSICIWNLKK